MELGVLVSGRLGLTVLTELKALYRIAFVLTDKGSAGIIEFCSLHGLPYFAGNPRGKEVLNQLGHPPCDVLVSVNYLFIVGEDIIAHPRVLAVNFHGSLLPRYRGRTPHVWAIINNEKKTGITAHVIDQGCDTGDVLFQLEVPIEAHHTGQDLLDMYANLYPDFVRKTLTAIGTGTFHRVKQDETKATYFGKRTAEDGRIDWNWQKERINNWVRAQARPYPGAFSFIGNHKLIIHKIGFSERGFHYDTANGTVLALTDGKPVVKTPNGCVMLLDFESGSPIRVNDLLN